MRIGDLAERSGLSVHAIRWYESQRLIPEVRRNASGHRLYDEWHVNWLALLDRLKMTGMTISQMAAYAALVRKGQTTLLEQRKMFIEHLAQATQQIEAQRRAIKHIERKIKFIEQWIQTGKRPAIGARFPIFSRPV